MRATIAKRHKFVLFPIPFLVIGTICAFGFYSLMEILRKTALIPSFIMIPTVTYSGFLLNLLNSRDPFSGKFGISVVS